MSFIKKEEPVLFDKKKHVGIFTLNRPNVLNALNLESVLSLKEKLTLAFSDPNLSILFIRGAGEKAFCAGGDVKTIAQDLIKNPSSTQGDIFFKHEYELDLLIHHSPKPVVVLAHGITMGGGVGLLAGAKLRIVSSTSQLAMPEISIGFFPDVGASFFLRKAPGKIGLFLALTGAKISAADALFANLANLYIPQEQTSELIHFFGQLDKNLSSQDLLQVTQNFLSSNFPTQESQLNKLLPTINSILDTDNVNHAFFCSQLLENPQFSIFTQALHTSSPESHEKIIQHWKNTKDLSLKECLQKDYQLAQEMIRSPNFIEGVRSVLLDKNNKPNWIKTPK